MIKNFIITSDLENMRLDRWYKNYVTKVPQSFIEKNIRKGNIKVNNKKERSSYKLKIKDEITIFNFNILPIKNFNKKIKYQSTKKEISQVSKFIIENNDNFIVINKPAGIAVQSGTKSKKNILDILNKSKYFNETSPFTVHRIDKETTGVLIIAKNRKYAQILSALFRKRKINKTYLSIVCGELKISKGTFKDTLYYYDNNNKKITNDAVAHYKVIDTNGEYSVLQLNPVTGRKHQLRKQLLLRNHPIFGDSKYNNIDKYKNKKNSLMLHAYKINFSIEEKKYKFIADLPVSFKHMLKQKYLKNVF